MSLLLLSGGVDSALLAETESVSRCLFVHYGQTSAAAELAAATLICETLDLPLSMLSVEIPGRPADFTFNLPGRNTVLCTLASIFAASVGENEVIIGINCDDYDDYVDCRLDWVVAVNQVLELQGLPKVFAPLLYTRKAEILERSTFCRVPLASKSTCYLGTSCGECGACKLRGAYESS